MFNWYLNDITYLFVSLNIYQLARWTQCNCRQSANKYIPSLRIIYFICNYTKLFFIETCVCMGTGSQSTSQIQRNWRWSPQRQERILLFSCGLAGLDPTSWRRYQKGRSRYERFGCRSHTCVAKTVSLSIFLFSSTPVGKVDFAILATRFITNVYISKFDFSE